MEMCQAHCLIHACMTKEDVPGLSCFHTSLLRLFFVLLNDCHLLHCCCLRCRGFFSFSALLLTARQFNIMLDETDALSDDLQEWRRPDLSDEPPPPLEIEVFVDTSHLTQNQSLVIVDDAGRRWDVADSLAAESSSRANGSGGRYYEVVLERWTIELGDMGRYKASQLNDQLPNVYKKGVLLFRSLYTYARFLPAWKLHKRLSRQPSNAQPLKLRFRIRQGRRSSTRQSKDALHTPLCPSEANNNTTSAHHDFEPLLCAAGPLTISIDYRTNADLTVADAEALLSSRFTSLDAGMASRPRHPGDAAGGRSLPGGHGHAHGPGDTGPAHDGTGPTGSARGGGRVAGGGAYGSLGTFHTTSKRESPVSTLRHRAASGASDSTPPPERRVTAQSIPTTTDYLKNPPFKAGSVASSPRNNAAFPSPSTSAPRPSPLTGTSNHSKRLSLNTLPQQALRNPGGMAQDTAIASSGSTSPKPAPVHRYNSSFAGRKRWTSTSQSSRVGESATSSGRASTSSKEKSGQLASEQAPGTPGSSGSARTDEDDIAAFISTIEKAKDMKSFSSARKPAAHNQVVNLARFKNMSLASSELADEMSSSSLSNVPGLSTSSSPSRMQPHAPHVRSRLSTQSIAEEIGGSEKGRKPEREVEEEDEEAGDEGEDSDDDEPFIFQQDNIL
jgi:autophagy-related protein 13